MARENVMEQALRYLSKQSYSCHKLLEKLVRAGFEENDISECLNRLIAWGYLDDRKYGIRCIELLQSRLKSRNYTRLYLVEAGLDKALAEELLAEFYPPELEIAIAQKVLAKRKGNSNRREWTFLTRAGFEEDTVHKCFSDISPT